MIKYPMAEEKEKTVQKSYRLPAAQVDLIDRLVDRGIYGSTGSAVVRTLLGNAIKELIETEFVKKHMETLELLRKK